MHRAQGDARAGQVAVACGGLSAGVLAKLNDIAFRVEPVADCDAIEGPLTIGWLHESAMPLG